MPSCREREDETLLAALTRWNGAPGQRVCTIPELFALVEQLVDALQAAHAREDAIRALPRLAAKDGLGYVNADDVLALLDDDKP
jgi:hypothetical protein